jgi:hypothetical protein
MGVPMKIDKKPQNRSSRQPKEEIIMPDKPSIEEIEKHLGIDKAKIRPILASPSDIKDLEEKNKQTSPTSCCLGNKRYH